MTLIPMIDRLDRLITDEGTKGELHLLLIRIRLAALDLEKELAELRVAKEKAEVAHFEFKARQVKLMAYVRHLLAEAEKGGSQEEEQSRPRHHDGAKNGVEDWASE